MIALDESRRHEEAWLLLPWLANGRLSAAERESVQEHVQRCADCQRELALQHLMCEAFTEPDRVTYAPGPSFRKLTDRIDSAGKAGEGKASKARPNKSATSLTARPGHVSLWRPPGLAWAASFLILFGITGMMLTGYRWSQPVFKTLTDTSITTPHVLYIALDRSLPIGEVEEVLRTGGARLVESPGNTGVLGVTPVGVIVGHTTEESANKQLRTLAARLRADPRVLWVQPLDKGTPADRVPAAADQRAPDAREH